MSNVQIAQSELKNPDGLLSVEENHPNSRGICHRACVHRTLEMGGVKTFAILVELYSMTVILLALRLATVVEALYGRMCRSPWCWAEGVGKFNSRGLRSVVEKVGSRFYRLKLPQELSRVHDSFHVPLDEIEIDENLRFVEEPIEIVERDVKKLKRRRIPLVKVRWNSRQGAEYTWEHEDQFRMKYPHLFSEPVLSSSAAT
ncbi:hypothetical protein Tco_0597027 [Tanacetum coccineum]